MAKSICEDAFALWYVAQSRISSSPTSCRDDSCLRLNGRFCLLLSCPCALHITEVVAPYAELQEHKLQPNVPPVHNKLHQTDLSATALA